MSQEMVASSQMNSLTDSFGLPVDPDVLFSNHKGAHKKRIEKRQSRFIERVQFIRPFLHEDEKILLVTTACSPMGLIEQLLTGWVIYQLKQCYFIFTNKRIFHVPLKAALFSWGGSPQYRSSIAQILYADCETIKQRGQTLTVAYKSGKREKFYHVAGKERRSGS